MSTKVENPNFVGSYFGNNASHGLREVMDIWKRRLNLFIFAFKLLETNINMYLIGIYSIEIYLIQL